MSTGLSRQTLPILLRGLSQKSPPQAAVIGELDLLQNMILVKGSQADTYEFAPRPGTTSLPKTADVGSITTGMKLSTLGTALVLLSGTQCYRKAVDEWHQVSANVPIMGVDSKSVTANSLVANAVDVASVGGYTVAASATADGSTGSIKVAVTDVNGATVVSSVIATGTVVGVRVVVSGTVAIILWESLPNSIIAAKFDSTAPATIGVPVTVTSTAAALAFDFDAQTVPASGNLAICWKNAGTSQLNQVFLTPSSMSVSGLTVYAGLTGFTTFSYLTNNFSSSVLYIGHVDPVNGLRYSTFNGATLALTGTTVYDAASTTAINIIGNRAGAAVSIYFTVVATASYDNVIKLSTGAAASSVFPSLTLASRLLSANSTFYALARYRSPGNSTYFLLDLVNGIAIGEAYPDIAFSGDYQSQDQLPNLQAVSSSVWLTAGMRNTAIATDNGTILSHVGASTIQFTYQDSTVGKPVELNGGLHIPGAVPLLYDGSTITEEGFPIGPEVSDALVPSAGGSMTSGAVYTYRWLFEWIDAAGNLHRSNPSLPLSVTMGATDTRVTHAIPALRLTRKTGVALATYRTLANGDGSTYFKVSSTTNPTANNPLVNRVAFVDTMSDAIAAAGEPLYSTTANFILENIAPPPCRSFAVHKGRMLIGGVDNDSKAVWFSKDVSPGFGVSFSDALVSRLSSTEPVKAVGTMDAFAVATTATTTWASQDDYPDDTGSGGVLRFTQYSGSVGTAAVGLSGRNDQGTFVYAGTKGIWRMSRGLAFDYVGMDVEDDMVNVQPNAIIAVPAQNQMRIILPGSSPATVLVYESLFGQWATWLYQNFADSIRDATVLNGVIYYLLNDGTVVQEDTTIVADDANRVVHQVRFSDLNFAGVAGFARLYIVQLTGRVLAGSGTFTLSAHQAFDGTAIADKSMNYAGAETALSFEVDPGTMGKCSTYELTVSDGVAAQTTARWTLAAMTALVGMKSGLSKLPPARRAV